jgi:S1-C subfamily serine protease
MVKKFVPAGRLSCKVRPFRKVVSDIRHAVFSVNRYRPLPDGNYQVTPLGSGFFVSSKVFVTCWHVIDGLASPHKTGDLYRLVNNLDGTHGFVHDINGGIGKDIHLYPDQDFAILLSDSKLDQAFLPISYSDIPVGQEIGVAGYPLGRLIVDSSGSVTLGGLVYRVAKGVATAYYRTDLNSGDGHPLKDRMVLEVNFLFVPGNSGGPIFDAETGRAIAYVKGFQRHKIAEVHERCELIPLPAGMTEEYLDSVYAVYSNGLTLEPVRAQLEEFGVRL